MPGTTSTVQELPFGSPPPRLAPPPSQLSERHRQILDDLETLFVKEGFAKFTVQQLAAKLRCSRRTLYEIAPSKDELVLVVLDQRARNFGRLALDRVANADDPLGRIEAFLHVGASGLKRSTIGLLEDIAHFPAARRLVASHYRHMTLVSGALLEQGVERGQIRPIRARLVAEILDAALDRLQDPEMLKSVDATYEEACLELIALLRHGVESRGLPSARRNGSRTNSRKT